MNQEEELNISQIKKHSIKAVKWSMLAEIVSYSVRPLVLLILARLLSPADFGLVGIATVAIGLAQIFQEFGFGKALIQTENNIDKYANNAFWINISLGLFIYFLIFITAPYIAEFFDSEQSILVLRVLCIQIVLTGFYSVQFSSMRRNMNFKSIFIVRFLAAVLPGVLSVLLALFDMGVWSLVYGSLLASLIQAILFWKLSNWRPTWSFDFVILKKMLIFSRWILLEGLLAWLISWGDSIIIGHYLGVNDLGIYRVGSTLIIFVSSIFFSPIVPIALSYFSRLQSNLRDLQNSYVKLTQLITAFSIPLGIGIALLSKPIVMVFLGEKWIGVEIVISLMAIRLGLGWIVGLNSTVYTAIGKPKLNVGILIIVTAISIPAYILGAQYGLFIFCLVRLATTLVDNFLNYMIAKKTLDLPFHYLMKPVFLSLSGTAIMAGVIVLFMKYVSIDNLFILILAVMSGILSYIAALLVIKKDFVFWGYRYGLQILR